MSIERIQNKKRMYEFSKSIHKANLDNIDDILKEYFHKDAVWYGPHPFNNRYRCI